MKKPPKATPARLLEALTLLKKGDIAGAEAICLGILRQQALQPEALHFYGLIAMQSGRFDESVIRLKRAAAVAPKNADVHANLGLALMRLGRNEQAAASLERSLALNPNETGPRFNYGLLLSHMGRYADALSAFDFIISREMDHADAHYQRSCALSELNRLEEALAAQQRALGLQPDSAVFLAAVAATLCLLERYTEAEPFIQKALTRQPGMELALLCRVAVLCSRGELQEGLQVAERLIAENPQSLQGHIRRSRLLILLGQPESALGLSAFSRNIAPDDPITHVNHGFILTALNRFEEALVCYDRALALKPADIDASYNRAFALLVLGRLEEGWRAYECRHLRQNTAAIRSYAKPRWLGEDQISNRRLYVYCEQGLGDTIHFSRYALLGAAAGAQVFLSVQTPLKRLFRNFHPAVTILDQGEVLPDFDLHSPLLSLPLAFATTLANIPAWPDGYLNIPIEETAHWLQRVPTGRRRIGLVWSGSAAHPNDANRSVALARLSPLFRSGDVWVSLQKEVRASDRNALHAASLCDLTDELTDFADTAALIAALDLVITVDTSVAHLAAALGKPVWLMLPFSPDFRWLLDREDSPWYPNMRLFRQERPGDWDSVVTRISAALQP
jgi:tetratricopeptide (TPR) repeat protein